MRHEEHHKRENIFLISFLLLFGIIFLVTMLNLRRQIPTLGLGMDIEVENWTILILSVLAIFKVFGMLIKN